MTDDELLEEVRQLRAAGATPRTIARALGLPPAVAAGLVRRVAAEAAAVPVGARKVEACWVSPGWSRELTVRWREGWDDVDVGVDGPAGMAQVLLARAARHDRVSVVGFLVDAFCLGVKNVLGPQEMRGRELPGFARAYFSAFPAAGVPVPLELAQHLVHGAVRFAASLGFEPHPEFEAASEYLGDLDEPCAIDFGCGGRPLYVTGPYDDPVAVLETLKAAVGREGFAVAT